MSKENEELRCKLKSQDEYEKIFEQKKDSYHKLQHMNTHIEYLGKLIDEKNSHSEKLALE